MRAIKIMVHTFASNHTRGTLIIHRERKSKANANTNLDEIIKILCKNIRSEKRIFFQNFMTPKSFHSFLQEAQDCISRNAI